MKQKGVVLSIVLMLAACTMTPPPVEIPGAIPEGQIAAVVIAANDGEIQQGNAAATRATSGDVRSFAQMMVSDHTAALTAARDTFTRLGITPQENDVTATLRSTTPQTITNLNTYNGAAFDRAYIRHQVDLHQWLLRALDESLIPSARTPELRALLTTQRGAVAQHLEQARQLSGRL